MAAFETELTAARPQALGALTRYFRDLDRGEDAFQDACLRALRWWPEKGVPRDPVAWLIFVGRNAGLDERRRIERWSALPSDPDLSEEELGSSALVGQSDTETERLESMAKHPYRDDVLRLLFICCHPALPLPQQIALALRVVAGLSVSEIARAFLVAPRAMEQRITRAKRRIARAEISFSTPTAPERAMRLDTVTKMIYLLFNEGYAASGGESHVRAPLCREAIRLARILLTLFPLETEIMGLLALCLLQHARHRARLDVAGDIVLLEDQDRALWDAAMIAEGGVMIEKALRRGRPGPLQIQAAIAAVHAHAPRAADTDWCEIDRLYVVLEYVAPSPVVTLNRAVAVSKVRGEAEALALIEPLADPLAGYFHFHGVRGALLAKLDRPAPAKAALTRALELARTPAEAEHIRRRLKEVDLAASGRQEAGAHEMT